MNKNLLLIFLSLYLGVFSCSVTDHNPEKDKEAEVTTPGGYTPENFDIYLLIGQSNMAGRAEITNDLLDTLENVFLFNGFEWEKAANPLNKYSTSRKSIEMQKLGPAYTFAKTLSQQQSHGIGLVVNARGGTSIEQWQKGYSGSNDFDLYEGALDRIKKVQDTGAIKGIIWHQGESNQNNTTQYLSLLNKMIWDFRGDLELPQLYFLAGEIGKWRSSSEEINALIQKIPDQINNAGYVISDGLTPLNGDLSDPHFDTVSQQTLGMRYANHILEVLYQ